MGRFARVNESGRASHNQPRRVPPPATSDAGRVRSRERQTADDPYTPSRRAPSEWKYFVLALAALLGLGIGWLTGKAVSGWLPGTSPPAVAEPASSVSADQPSASVPASQAPTSQAPMDEEATTAQEAASNTAAPDADTASVEQAAQQAAPARHGRRAGRHVSLRQQSRGNFFFRPFKAFRRLKVW